MAAHTSGVTMDSRVITKEDKLLSLEQKLISMKINIKTLKKIDNILLLKILEEVLNNENENEFNIDAEFNLFILFNKFVTQKFNIYSVEEKKKIYTNVPIQKEDEDFQKKYEKEHEILALKLLFGESKTEQEIDYEQLKKIGLVSQANDKKIDFIHKNFAEYFVASHIQKNFTENQVIKLLFTDVLFKKELTVLRAFINDYIQDNLSDGETIMKYRRYIEDNFKNINLFTFILLLAVIENNFGIVTFILECFKQNPKMLDRILSYGGKRKLMIPLPVAINRGNQDIARQIISYCDEEIMNKHCAAYKYMYGKGDIRGVSAIHEASFKGHAEVVRLLLSKGVNVNINDNAHALTSAINYNLGIKNTYDISHGTPLHYAASGGQTELVHLLLAEGVNVDETDMSGRTALHLAADGGHSHVVSLLLAKGASVDSDWFFSSTPLHNAASKGHTVVVQQFLDHGVDVNETDITCRTAMQIAFEEGHYRTVQAFLRHGNDFRDYGDSDRDSDN